MVYHRSSHRQKRHILHQTRDRCLCPADAFLLVTRHQYYRGCVHVLYDLVCELQHA
jgi:hypothetical protein